MKARLAIAAGGAALLCLPTACGRQALSEATNAVPSSITIGAAPTTAVATTLETTTTAPPETSTTTTAPATTTTATTAAPVTIPMRAPGVPARLAAPGPLPVLGDAIPEAGQWKPIGPDTPGGPAMYATQYPSKVGSPIAVGVAWIDPGAVRAVYQPGTTDPPGKWGTPPFVKPEWQHGLAAVFNSGFKSKDSRGGIYLEGREASPLKAGAASAVIDADGVLTVGQWGRDVAMNDRIVSVRQNLELIVDDGKVNPRIKPNDISEWGATLDQKIDVFRSAIGVRRDGAIIYAGGPGLNARDIADIMAATGCVRAMELDINDAWVTFNSFTWNADKNAPQGAKLNGAMTRPDTRFLVADERDFFSLFTR